MMKEETLILTLFCLGSLAKTILDPNDYRNYAGMRTKKKRFKAAMQAPVMYMCCLILIL